MAGNTFGTLFKITTFGESHGKGIGVVIDGCPSGLELDQDHIFAALQRRKPGQSKKKYGIRDYRGGGRSSARETAARVIAGAIAQQILSKMGIMITAYVSQVGDIEIPSNADLDYSTIEDNIIRCPHPETAIQMIDHITKIKKKGDTVGGKISAVISGAPVGVGSPVFDKLHAELGKAMLSINAVKGFEVGSGFDAIHMNGSEHNDAFENVDGKITTKTNYSGGIQGGISNGMDITFNVAFKPVATIIPAQESVDTDGKKTTVYKTEVDAIFS